MLGLVESSKYPLSGNEAKLCLSHIVPEFCYKSIYEDKHRLVGLSATAEGIKRSFMQKGHREPLFCQGCETHLSHYERIFHDFWYKKVIPIESVEAEFPIVRGIDYNSMKLFHLSVIWRHHLAAEVGNINLGLYADIIRGMLLKGDAGPEDYLPVLGCLLLDDEKKVMDRSVSMEPEIIPFGHADLYAICYAGCDWLFLVGEPLNQAQKKTARVFGIRKNGTMRLMTSHYRKSRSWDKLVNLR